MQSVRVNFVLDAHNYDMACDYQFQKYQELRESSRYADDEEDMDELVEHMQVYIQVEKELQKA